MNMDDSDIQTTSEQYLETKSKANFSLSQCVQYRQHRLAIGAIEEAGVLQMKTRVA